MRKIQWYQQSEETDEDGFYIQELAPASENERKILCEFMPKELVDQVEFLSLEVEDRDMAVFTANVPDEVAVKMRDEELLVVWPEQQVD